MIIFGTAARWRAPASFYLKQKQWDQRILEIVMKYIQKLMISKDIFYFCQSKAGTFETVL